MGSTHTLLEPTVIAKEALMLLRNNLVMGAKVHRDYEQEFGDTGIGDTVTIRKPVKFTVTTGRTRSTSTITEKSITLQVAYQKHISWAFNTKDLTLTIQQYSKRYIEPAAARLANEIDSDLLGLYSDVHNAVYESTGFVTPESFMVLGKVGQRLDEEAVPQGERCLVLNPAAHWSMANALRTLYVQDVAAPAVKKGYMATIANMEIYMDQNVRVHTTGAFHDTGSTAELLMATTSFGGAATEGSALEIIHLRIVSTDALIVGDVFTVADVNAVNPMSGEDTGTLRQFVVTAAMSVATTSTTQIDTVYIKPEMIDTGPYKTITTFPAAGAAVTVVGTQSEPYPQNLGFHKNAFALVMVPLITPHNVWGSSARADGYAIRVLKDYDVNTDDEICRMDVLYGVKTLYPELAVRLIGAEG